MVGAHQNLDGLRDLTTPLSGWFVTEKKTHPGGFIPQNFSVIISPRSFSWVSCWQLVAVHRKLYDNNGCGGCFPIPVMPTF